METIDPANSCPFSAVLAGGSADRFVLPGFTGSFVYLATVQQVAASEEQEHKCSGHLKRLVTLGMPFTRRSASAWHFNP